MVFNFVKENSPDLGKYGYKEWDKDTHDYVNHVISAVTGQANVSQNYANVKNDAPASNDITSQDLNIDELDKGINTDLPDLDLPNLDTPSDAGIGGNLDDVLKNL